MCRCLLAYPQVLVCIGEGRGWTPPSLGVFMGSSDRVQPWTYRTPPESSDLSAAGSRVRWVEAAHLQLFEDPSHALSLAASVEEDHHEYGAVFTRRWVVELILDLVGYTPDRDLAATRAIEPACGTGAFLGPMVERLATSCQRHGRQLTDAAEALRACDLQPSNVDASSALVVGLLTEHGAAPEVAGELARHWVRHEDFLLARHEVETSDFVVGNPPYIRLEDVSVARTEAYRRACLTMGGRADVYVGFYEVGLRALKHDGALGFICADRWMRNQYGQRLRALVSSEFAVEAAIEMHDADAFEAEVSAYPSITVIRRSEQGRALVANAHAGFKRGAAVRLRKYAAARKEKPTHCREFDAAWLPGWFPGAGSWPTGSPDRLSLLAELERTLPPLSDPDTGTAVGIGVATGADGVFVVKDAGLVEADRLLPMAMARDTMSGHIEWSGSYLVDPWDADTGALVSLDDYPRLAKYLNTNGALLRKRNVASRRPASWYRTIDRVDHTLTTKPKLLFPDIKATIHPVLDDGRLYPHHNLYWVTSEQWDLSVLGGLLLSRAAQMFIESYAVKMRGGYLRFQAQYLRRIRVPTIESVSTSHAGELAQAFAERDVERATAAALQVYGLKELPR